MVSPNSAMIAPQQAGKAPICRGNTTCCATTSPLVFMSAQLASCDSRTMVEKPVRNSEFCISCTMPERLAFTTSRSTASMCIRHTSGATYSAVVPAKAATQTPCACDVVRLCIRSKCGWLWVPALAGTTRRVRRCLASFLPRHDQVLPFIHVRDLARAYYGGAIKLVENSGSLNGEPDIEAVALIDRAFDRFAFEAGMSPFPQGVLERCAGWRETRHRNRWHTADPAHPIGHDLDRLLGCVVAEHQLVLRIESVAERAEVRIAAWHGDLVALARIAHVERTLDRHRLGRKAVLVQFLRGHRFKTSKKGVHILGLDLVDRRHPRLDIVVLDVRHDKADRRIDARIERHDHAGHAEVARHAPGVHRTSTAEGEQHEIAQVVAAHGGNGLDRLLHLDVDDAHDAFGGLFDAHA